jgi:hypothetical protein
MTARSLGALLVVIVATSCSRGGSLIDAPFVDTFERAELGRDWVNTGAPYRIQDGALRFSMAHNHPLWLDRRLPDDVQVDFDVVGYSPQGDLKVELFGDGKSFEDDDSVKRDLQYTASGYVFIFGGWGNQLSTLVRQREHAWQYERGVPVRQDVKVVPGQRYHWTLKRRGGHLEWLIDGRAFLSWDDPQPLRGEGHDRFAFDGWESEASFDNLKIAPLSR